MTRSIFVKICGITDPRQAEQIAQLEVHALGLIVGAESARKISLQKAQEIIKHIPPFIHKIALVVNQHADKVKQIIQQLDIDYLQFHGDESTDYCNQFNFPYIRCLRVKATKNTSIHTLSQQMQQHLDDGAKMVLLDKWDSVKHGGTGESIDFNALRTNSEIGNNNLILPQPFILAGGINPHNVVQKIVQTRPYAIDVNSGVETNPGNKDLTKIRRLLEQVATIKF